MLGGQLLHTYLNSTFCLQKDMGPHLREALSGTYVYVEFPMKAAALSCPVRPSPPPMSSCMSSDLGEEDMPTVTSPLVAADARFGDAVLPGSSEWKPTGLCGTKALQWALPGG